VFPLDPASGADRIVVVDHCSARIVVVADAALYRIVVVVDMASATAMNRASLAFSQRTGFNG
jgi:hypothetical protein